MREKETPEERAERKFHDQAKLLHGDRLVMHHLDGLRKAVNAFSQNVGKGQSIQNRTLTDGLAAIALAASTPTDNSEEVKALTAKLKSSTDDLEAAVDAAPEQSETQ